MKNIKQSIEEKAVGIKYTSKVFVDGFTEQLDSEITWCVSAYCGIVSGLKYGGSLKRGLITTAVIAGGLSTFNGIRRVYLYKRCR